MQVLILLIFEYIIGYYKGDQGGVFPNIHEFCIHQDIVEEFKELLTLLLPVTFRTMLNVYLQFDFIGSLIKWHNEVKFKKPYAMIVTRLELACIEAGISSERLRDLSSLLKDKFTNLNRLHIPMSL